MNDFLLHPEAYADLDDIWEYIAADNLDAADRVREEIYEKIRSLVTFPHQGHTRADLTSQPLRFQSVRDFVIAYAPEEKPKAVIPVLHGRRNPRVIAALPTRELSLAKQERASAHF
ncbi:MAG: type II toxin-antitoxin system RelE/ParE family toxin [Terriglobales bacterium]